MFDLPNIPKLCSKDVDKATSTRIKLEKQLENLEAELTFLQGVHKEVIIHLPV